MFWSAQKCHCLRTEQSKLTGSWMDGDSSPPGPWCLSVQLSKEKPHTRFLRPFLGGGSVRSETPTLSNQAAHKSYEEVCFLSWWRTTTSPAGVSSSVDHDHSLPASARLPGTRPHRTQRACSPGPVWREQRARPQETRQWQLGSAVGREGGGRGWE